jgi:hypothetical protein
LKGIALWLSVKPILLVAVHPQNESQAEVLVETAVSRSTSHK